MTVSIRSALADGARTLGANGVTEPRLEASSLLGHATSRDRAFIITHADDALTPEELETLRSLVARRAAGEPLQYITGHQEFFKLDFEVSPEVLIPRPETEIIVEVALEFLGDKPAPLFADIGTGSGCITISLLNELSAARAVATDASPAALRVAQRNADRHAVTDRLTLIESDCFSALDPVGKFDLIVQRIVDGWMSFPDLVILLVVVSVLGPGLPQIILTLALLLGIASSRIIRSAVVSVRENMYVHAAQSIGASTGRILWRHILPNIMPPIIVLFTTRVGTVILAESSLSFLGLGAQPPTAEWGLMLSESRRYIRIAWWLAVFPGVAIMLAVLAVNILGDAARDALDPRISSAAD